MNLIKQLFLLLIFPLLIFSSCKKDALLTDSSAHIEFSTDSVLFDTVFTTVGSTTKIFKIYNFHSKPLNISKIYLAGGTHSPFRINVDGVSGISQNNVEIQGGDSLYVFVQVTVNPTNINSPLLIKDSVIFETNGNIQNVKLTAIGQDVHLFKPDHFPTNGLPAYSIIPCNSTWVNDKPYLIFGYAVVDSGCTLTISQGTHVYMHNNAVLWVYKDGTLIINGQHMNEVTFQGDRLESDYKNLPGQWGKIWMMKGSKNNTIDWAIIKNGSIGLQVDSVNTSSTPSLKLTNTIVENMEAAGLYAQGAYIWCNNSVFANCGQYAALLNIGGKYSFEQCTFADYWSTSSRTTPLLAMNNYYVDNSSVLHIRTLDSAYFGNCIIYGDLAEELALDSTNSAAAPPGSFYYKFDHCIVRTAHTAGSYHNNTVINSNPNFKDVTTNNYQLNSPSPAIDAGSTLISIPLDLNSNARSSIPDLGAYEYH